MDQGEHGTSAGVSQRQERRRQVLGEAISWNRCKRPASIRLRHVASSHHTVDDAFDELERARVILGTHGLTALATTKSPTVRHSYRGMARRAVFNASSRDDMPNSGPDLDGLGYSPARPSALSANRVKRSI
jgi:hypothetical protein